MNTLPTSSIALQKLSVGHDTDSMTTLPSTCLRAPHSPSTHGTAWPRLSTAMQKRLFGTQEIEFSDGRFASWSAISRYS